MVFSQGVKRFLPGEKSMIRSDRPLFQAIPLHVEWHGYARRRQPTRVEPATRIEARQVHAFPSGHQPACV